MHWIFLGDFNTFNERPILNLSNQLKQIVDFPTRLNPDNTLDKIITSMSRWYKHPTPLPHLECDDDMPGRPSDHLPVLWEPLDVSFPANKMRSVTVRPFPDSSVREFGRWVAGQDWSELYNKGTVDEKAEFFQEVLLSNFNLFFPEKNVKFHQNDKPWITSEIKRLDRRRKRAWVNKGRNSPEYKILHEQYLTLCKNVKQNFYQKTVKSLKESNISQWYRQI